MTGHLTKSVWYVLSIFTTSYLSYLVISHSRDGVTLAVSGDVALIPTLTVSYCTPIAVALQTIVLLNIAHTIYRPFQGSALCIFGLKMIPLPTAGVPFGKVSVSTRQ
jgi:hypothetical protein